MTFNNFLLMCLAQVKLSVPGKIPLVTIYTRLEGLGTLCTINDVIGIEHELEELVCCCWTISLNQVSFHKNLSFQMFRSTAGL